MAWAKEMGALVHGIQASHRERTHFVNESKRNTHELLTAARELVKDLAAGNKEMADDLRVFLDKSESSRRHDFKTMMEGINEGIKEIQSRVKEVRGGVPDFLAKSESTRKHDFKTMMDEIVNRIDAINKDVASVRKSARDMVGDLKAEHKEAAARWASLPERMTVSEEAAEEAAKAEVRHEPHHKKK